MEAVPVAKDRNGQIVLATVELDKFISGPFTCLDCGHEVLLHQGTVIKPYFRHRPSSNNSTTPCQAIHTAAIEVVKQFLSYFRVQRQCCNCGSLHVVENFTDLDVAQSEVPICDGRYRADVCVYSKQKIKCLVEIFYTHAIGADKRLYLQQQAGLKVYELDARAVLKAYETNEFLVQDLWEGYECPFCISAWQHCISLEIPCTKCHKLQPFKTEEVDRTISRLQSVKVQSKVGMATIPGFLCKGCSKRPCLGCKTWLPLQNMTSIEPPPFTSKYPTAYVCKNCTSLCQTCSKEVVAGLGQHCAGCQREAAAVWRKHRNRWRQNTWPYGTAPPSLASLRRELFLQTG